MIFRVDAADDSHTTDAIYFSVQLKGTVGYTPLDSDHKIPYADLEMRLAGGLHKAGDGKGNYVAIGANLLSAAVERNLQLDNGLTARLSFIGFEGRINAKLAEDVEFFVNLIADVLGTGISRTGTAENELVSSFGNTFAGKAEAGLRIAKTSYIKVGQKGQYLGAEVYENGGIWCFENCKGTAYDRSRTSSSTYLDVKAELAKNLIAFVEAQYSTFNVTEQYNPAQNATNKSMQVFVGLGGRW